MRDASVKCIGCNKPITRKPYVVDDNGETGCPACFTDDGSGECWHRAALAIPAAKGEKPDA